MRRKLPEPSQASYTVMLLVPLEEWYYIALINQMWYLDQTPTAYDKSNKIFQMFLYQKIEHLICETYTSPQRTDWGIHPRFLTNFFARYFVSFGLFSSHLFTSWFPSLYRGINNLSPSREMLRSFWKKMWFVALLWNPCDMTCFSISYSGIVMACRLRICYKVTHAEQFY